MARKCFISFKMEDVAYKEAIQHLPGIDIIDKSLDAPIDSDVEDYVMQQIRANYLSDSTVTLHLIGAHSGEHFGEEEQKFIKGELRASLYDREDYPRSGILGIVLPSAYGNVYKGTQTCGPCGNTVGLVAVDDSTTIAEFSHNYYIPNGKCHHGEDERYCVLVKWDDFRLDPNRYIELAFAKREHSIANKVRVRP